jgi:uncharacterized protein (DUF305 family)
MTITKVMAATLFGAALCLPLSPQAHAELSQNQAFEIRFMEDMIDHHALAVERSRLCRERATNADLLALCADMVKTQKTEIATMQGWLREWYGESSTPRETPHGRRDTMHMASLDGAEFEKEFMTMMVGHHAVAIEQSAECLVRTSHGALTALCEDMTRTQATEIRKMRTWLCQWYRLCSLHVMRNMMVGKPEPR